MTRTQLSGSHRTIFATPARLFDLLNLWQARIDERRQLANLDERLMKDAGLSGAEVRCEAGKLFWRS